MLPKVIFPKCFLYKEHEIWVETQCVLFSTKCFTNLLLPLPFMFDFCTKICWWFKTKKEKGIIYSLYDVYYYQVHPIPFGDMMTWFVFQNCLSAITALISFESSPGSAFRTSSSVMFGRLLLRGSWSVQNISEHDGSLRWETWPARASRILLMVTDTLGIWP